MVLGNGRVIDQSQKNHLPGISYIPIKGKGWRVPVEGSLDEIMDRYRQQMNSMPLNQYNEVTYVREAASRRPPMHAFATMLEKAVRICDATFGNVYRRDGDTFSLVDMPSINAVRNFGSILLSWRAMSAVMLTGGTTRTTASLMCRCLLLHQPVETMTFAE